MKIKRTTGQHIGIGDRVDYYPQAEATAGKFNVVVLPAEDDEAPAWTGETAAKAAKDCEARLRMMLAGPALLAALEALTAKPVTRRERFETRYQIDVPQETWDTVTAALNEALRMEGE